VKQPVKPSDEQVSIQAKHSEPLKAAEQVNDQKEIQEQLPTKNGAF